jgi:hypothetical protein
MKWIARVFVFIAALVLGTVAGALFMGPPPGLLECEHSNVQAPTVPVPTVEAPVRAENLLGTWQGTWGHNSDDCTLEIDRVEGNAFYGKLRKEGAVILFEGTFDPKTRKLRFNETKVVRLGADMGEWSLGKNRGTMSQDGRTMVGDGQDKWGKYDLAASNY